MICFDELENTYKTRERYLIYGFHYEYTPDTLKKQILQQEKRTAIKENTLEINSDKFVTDESSGRMERSPCSSIRPKMQPN